MKYKSDIEKMQVALAEAKKALEIDEVPIGAALGECMQLCRK